MASIQRLKRGYRVRYREGGRGTEEKYITGLETKADAQMALERIEAELAARGEFTTGSLLPLAELLVRWARARTSGPRPNDTVMMEEARRRCARHIAAMGWTSTASITPAAVAAWRERMPGTVRVGSYLHALLVWGRDVLAQPVDQRALAGLKPPRRPRKDPEPLLPLERVEEIWRLAEQWGPEIKALLSCLSLYAWRPITAAKARVADLRGDRIRLKVKGGAIVESPLLPASAALLAKIAEGRPLADPLFRDPRTGRAFNERNPGTIPAFCRDRLKCKSYDVKRFAASNLLAVMPPAEAILFSGHRTTSQLLLYARTNEEKARVALTKLGALGHVPRGTASGALP